MVTKLKDNISYIKYIQKSIKESFPDWKEYGEIVYEGQIHDNFGISYIGNIKGYPDSIYKISFVKDRGLLELKIYDKNVNTADLGFLIYNGVSKYVPGQDKKWRLTLCTELIDYYIIFLKSYFEKNEIIVM